MCFSAQASFFSAGFLSILGLASVIQSPHKKYWPFALSPLFFGVQQALEGFVWTTLNNGNTTNLLHTTAVYGFNFFAGIFWPVWIPLSLFFIESNQLRKRILLVFVGLGSIISILSLYGSMQFGITATALNHHITYNLKTVPYSDVTVEWVSTVAWCLYLLVTAGSFFTSSIAGMWVLGILITLAFAVAHIFFRLSFGSVWCFFAAIMSALVYTIVTQKEKPQ